MLTVEGKRILKTKSTRRLLLLALVLSLFLGFYTVRHEAYYDYEEAGQTHITRGIRAYQMKQKKYAVIDGVITPELLSEAVTVYHRLLSQYGSSYAIPPKISSEVLGPYSPVYTWIGWSFTDENGAHFTAADLTPTDAQLFYRERLLTLERTLEKKYHKQPQVLDYAMSHLREPSAPFIYHYGIGSTGVFDNLGLCTFLVTLICLVILAPVFSSDYASGADDILRCTKRGRKSLAAAKLCSATLIGLFVWFLCIGAYLAVVIGAFGLDHETSAELLHVSYNPDALTTAGILGMIFLSSLLTFLAMAGFTLFLSSRLKNPLVVLAAAMAVAILPTVIRMFGANGSFGAAGIAGAEGNFINWFRFCLPSGGLTVVGSMLDALTSLHFVWIGDFVIWSPYVLLFAPVLQLPLWYGLAVQSYCSHQSA